MVEPRYNCVYGKVCGCPKIYELNGTYEPRYEKTGLRGFRPGPTQTGLYSYRK